MKAEEIKDVAAAVKALFQEKCGQFRLDDLVDVCRRLELENLKKSENECPSTMSANI